MAVKSYLTRSAPLRRTIDLFGMGSFVGAIKTKKQPLNLWLTAGQKRQMGARLSSEIQRARTTNADLARQIGCSRATLSYACRDGTISVELLAEVCRRINSSLDYIVFGRYPTADPEFLSLLDRLKSAAIKPPHH